MEPDNERAAGVARMMVEAQKHFNGSPTKELLWEWQSMIVDKDEDGVPFEKGRWRTSGMHIVNDSGRKKFNERQRKVISELYDEGVEGFAGGVRVQEYAKIAECGMDEARRDLMDLNAMGMLKDIVRFGRRRRYNINVPDRHGR